MKNLLIAGIFFLASCSTGSRSVTKKEKSSKELTYPYTSVYKNVGTVFTDTTKKNP